MSSLITLPPVPVLIYLKIAILQLIDQGLIQLDTPAFHILPQLANPIIISGSSDKDKPAERHITIKHLLSHTSGIAYPSEHERVIPDGLPTSYTTKYLNKEDGILQFFDIIKVKFGVKSIF
jgi:CubicO group peptidase (beta-lactamase class C family)